MVISITPTQAFEKSLAQGSDSCPLKGKFYLPVVGTTATPTSILILGPSALGGRASVLATVFSRYKFKYLRFKFMSSTGSSAPAAVSLGILDDASTAEGDFPITLAALAEFRCSATKFSNETVPTEFMWTPVDKSLWYYTEAGSSGSDQRLVNSGILIGASSASCSNSIEVDYSLVFKGAIDLVST
jgi:hypothetical protein